MPNKPHHEPGGPQTGDEFIDLAKKRGANVRPKGRFTAVETPSGKVYVNPSDQKLDKQTRGNLRKWFRLLGLMGFPLGIWLGLEILKALGLM